MDPERVDGAGIREEDLLSEMVALTPLSAKRLLDELLEQELVLVNVTRFMPAGPPGSPPQAEQVKSVRIRDTPKWPLSHTEFESEIHFLRFGRC